MLFAMVLFIFAGMAEAGRRRLSHLGVVKGRQTVLLGGSLHHYFLPVGMEN